jgi:hypothetical protein
MRVETTSTAEWKDKPVSLPVIKGKSHKQIFRRVKKGLSEAELIVDSCGLFSPAGPDSDD